MFNKFFIIVFCLFSYSSFSFSQENNYAIDPDLENYFESVYGYKNPKNSIKGNFKDSPISEINNNAVKNDFSNSLNNFNSKTIINTNKINYDNLPLYYEVKVINTIGPISSFVLDPINNVENKIKKYVLIEIGISEKNYNKAYSLLVSKWNFIFAAEDIYIKNGEKQKILLGWVLYDNCKFIMKEKNIESFSFSRRDNLIAPLTNVKLIIKAPYNRNPDLFTEAFSKEISKYGFSLESYKKEQNKGDKRYFLIEMKGKLPLDKLDIVLLNPFVFKINSNI